MNEPRIALEIKTIDDVLKLVGLCFRAMGQLGDIAVADQPPDHRVRKVERLMRAFYRENGKRIAYGKALKTMLNDIKANVPEDCPLIGRDRSPWQ